MDMHPLRLSLFALIFLAVLGMSQEAEAESVDVYVNHAQLSLESNFSFPNYIPFHMSVHLSGPYTYSEDDNLSVHSIIVNINFLSDTDRRNSCMSCVTFSYYDNEEDLGYDEYRTSFYPDGMGFEGYEGPLQIYLILKNSTGVPVWDSSFSIYLFSDSKTNNNLGDSNTLIGDNEIIFVAGGIVGLIIMVTFFRTRFPTNGQDPYALPKPDDNNYPTSYENDRRSDEVAKQIKTLEESEMDKGTNGDDKFTKLQDLKTMYREGLIDEEEFKKLKKEILD
jgi:hypothetical protein